MGKREARDWVGGDDYAGEFRTKGTTVRVWSMLGIGGRALHGRTYKPLLQVVVVAKALENPVVVKCHDTLEIAVAALRNLTSHVDVLGEIISLGTHKVSTFSD